MGIDWLSALKLGGVGFAIVFGVLTALYGAISVTGMVVRKLADNSAVTTEKK